MDLYLFYKDLETTLPVLSNRLSGLIFDWEYKGKINRQKDFNTEVNNHTQERIKQIKSVYLGSILVRINGGQYIERAEILKAIDSGADEIFLPMVKSIDEIEEVLTYINNQCQLSILLETNESLAILEQIKPFPISKFFFGLNDFAIQNNFKDLFTPLNDGTLENVSEKLNGRSFGFGGLTHPSKGSPIRCSKLMEKMASFKCDFSFLRRSFYKNLSSFNAEEIYKEITAKWDEINLSQSILKSQ